MKAMNTFWWYDSSEYTHNIYILYRETHLIQKNKLVLKPCALMKCTSQNQSTEKFRTTSELLKILGTPPSVDEDKV